MDYKQKTLEQAEKVLEWSLADLKDIPHIPLYMEQLTTFFDEELSGARRGDDDKILTKTMINNYTKEGTLPRPNGKKYSREHMIRLMYIFMLKQVLSLQDIKQMFDLLPSDGAGETMYATYLEMVEEHKQHFLGELTVRMDRVEEKLVEKGIYSDGSFAILLMLLTVTEATSDKMLVWKMLDELSHERRLLKESAKEKDREKK